MPDDTDAQYRLPRTAIPSAYRLRLEPDLEALRFEGDVAIDVDVEAGTDEILVNALDLEIDGAAAVLADGTTREATVTLDAEHERARLAFAEPLDGAVELRCSFRGTLNDLLVGFYRSTFTDEAGEDHTIATTQFATTDARRAFPCFDEPDFKATFAVTLIVPSHLAAYSNSPVVSERALGDGRREVSFAPTMKMSSYLVAVAIGPFESGPTIDVDGVPLTVVCPQGKVHLTDFALEVGAFALRFYADYFGIPYPGDKLDLVAIPDFAYGAMENLGCVTFRETALLVDPATASKADLEVVAMIVAHELAHMWFGDLVTMQWWEGIWLNEAFATFLQYVCIDAFRPKWKMWVRFGAELELGLTIDALHSTRPIEYPVDSPADAMAMIDVITYKKGGSVLRMLEQYLGADVYRDGIRRYLHDHAYANTVTSDLWDALEAESGKPVGEIMNTWVLQGGHPVVSSSHGSLSQAPFQFGPPEGDSKIGSSWIVPVLSRPLRGGATVSQLLGGTPAPLATAAPAIVNAGGAGVYRTSYDSDELAVIAAELGSLSEIERFVLLNDTRALARAGERTVRDVLTLARGLGTVIEPSAWATVDEFLGTLDRIVDDAQRPALRRTASALLAPVLDEIGWEPRPGEDERTSFVRSTVIHGLGCVAADPAVQAEAAARFDAGGLDGDLADAVIAVVASLNRPGDYDQMLRRFREAKDPQSEERYRVGVASIADRDLALSTFTDCFELFRVQDAPYVIRELMIHRAGGHAVWEALTERWDATVSRIPPLMQSAVGIGVVTFIDDRAFAERVRAFHREHPIETGQQHIEQALERMMTGVAFAERARLTLDDALR
jgi:puromycin-sensitive aminopeptidase